MKKYKVTNLTKEPRKFMDKSLGREVIIEPKKTFITTKPPIERDIWKVKIHTEKTEKIYSKKEVSKIDENNKNA